MNNWLNGAGPGGNGTGPTDRGSYLSRFWRGLTRGRNAAEDASVHRIAMQLNVDSQGPDNPRAALLVTPGEGYPIAVSSMAVAVALAEEIGRDVLLVDACRRASDLSRALGCEHNAGFSNFLADPGVGLDGLVLPTSSERVWFMPAGSAAVGTGSAEEIASLLRAGLERYDFILFSGGAVLSNPLALALAPRVGCVLLFAAVNETSVDDFEAAKDTLGLCNARRVGVVVARRH